MRNSVLILGVTGNIASGKSLVAALMHKRGAAVLSADQLAREVVVAGSPLLMQLATHFGAQILNAEGGLDRAVLGALVFADVSARLTLNRLMHPAIARLAERCLSELAQTDVPLVVYEAPLLYEAGADKRVDKVLVVTVAADIQLQRIVQRDRLDFVAARQRVEAQMAQAEKAARADYLIDNSGTLVELEAEVEKLWLRLCG